MSELPVTRNGIKQLPAGTFKETNAPCYAQLSIRRNKTGATSRGICGLLPFTAFTDGMVRPHEKTLVPRLQKQEKMVLPDQGALGKPILITVPSLKEWWPAVHTQYTTADQHLDFTGDDNRYTLRNLEMKPWVKEESGGDVFLELGVPGPLVIADGHHRAETHARLGERGVPGFSHVPVCLIGADELHIGVFARVIQADNAAEMFDRLKSHFKVERLDGPQAPRTVGQWLLQFKGENYRLHRRVRQGDVTDVDWLNSVVLNDACGITDVRTDERITFPPVEDPVDGLITESFPPEALTLIGFPLPKERFFAEVSAGRVLPPKSTRFEPRVPSGLVVWKGRV